MPPLREWHAQHGAVLNTSFISAASSAPRAADYVPPGGTTAVTPAARAAADAQIGTWPAFFVTSVIAIGGAIILHSVHAMISRPVSFEWLALLGLTAGAAWATLRIPTMPISFSISDTFSLIAALLVGPPAGALTAATDGLVLSYRMARTPRLLHRVLFNVTTPAIATWTSAQLFFMVAASSPAATGPLAALRLLGLVTAFGVCNYALNTGLVAGAVASERRKPVVAVWKEHFAHLWITHLGAAFAAMLMLVLSGAETAPSLPLRALDILVLIAPLPVILYVTFRHAMGRAADQIVQLERMNAVYVGAIEALAQAIDAKDQVTHDHIRRVQQNAVRLARALDVTDDLEIQAIKAAALLHDVGKLGVPEHILNKPGRLNAAEFEIMKRHAPMGADILSMIGFPYPVVPIVRHHHENWDGSGYPDGIGGERIPIGARILAVVDCYDALTSDRPYRPQLPDVEALAILTERKGTMYDPRVVEAFFALHAQETGMAHAPGSGGRDAAPAVPAPADAGPPAAAPDLDVVFRLGQVLPADGMPADSAATLWGELRHHLPASALVLFTYDASADALIASSTAGDPTVSPEARVALGDRLSGWVAASRQHIFNSDARLDLDGAVRDATRLRVALAVPVLVGADLRGVLTLYSREVDGFTDSHLRIAHAVAHVIAGRMNPVAAGSRPAS